MQLALGRCEVRSWHHDDLESLVQYADNRKIWLNLRATIIPVADDCGAHVGLRVRSTDLVDAFHAAALAAGGSCDGAPGLRPQHGEGYYAAFIRDPDGNRIEAVTFLTMQA